MAQEYTKEEEYAENIWRRREVRLKMQQWGEIGERSQRSDRLEDAKGGEA
jgi:hypothetical protein